MVDRFEADRVVGGGGDAKPRAVPGDGAFVATLTALARHVAGVRRVRDANHPAGEATARQPGRGRVKPHEPRPAERRPAGRTGVDHRGRRARPRRRPLRGAGRERQQEGRARTACKRDHGADQGSVQRHPHSLSRRADGDQESAPAPGHGHRATRASALDPHRAQPLERGRRPCTAHAASPRFCVKPHRDRVRPVGRHPLDKRESGTAWARRAQPHSVGCRVEAPARPHREPAAAPGAGQRDRAAAAARTPDGTSVRPPIMSTGPDDGGCEAPWVFGRCTRSGRQPSRSRIIAETRPAS